MCDIRMVMKFVTTKAGEAGITMKQHEPITMRKINQMYEVTEPILLTYARDIQKQWLSFVPAIRKIWKKEKQNEQFVEINNKEDSEDEHDF